jgi:hypothetical protein
MKNFKEFYFAKWRMSSLGIIFMISYNINGRTRFVFSFSKKMFLMFCNSLFKTSSLSGNITSNRIWTWKPFFSHEQLLFPIIGDKFFDCFRLPCIEFNENFPKTYYMLFFQIWMGTKNGFCSPTMGGLKPFFNHQ